MCYFCLKDKQLTLADFPDHIQDLKQKGSFIITRQGHTKLFLPAGLVEKLVEKHRSNSKELIDVETEAMKEVRKKSLEQQKIKKEQKIKGDQQELDDETLKELRSAGIDSRELASLAREQQNYENKQKKKVHTKGNKELTEHQKRVKEAQEMLKLDNTSDLDVAMLDIEKQKMLLEEATSKKINKDSLNIVNEVGSALSEGNDNDSNSKYTIKILPGNSQPNVQSGSDSNFSHENHKAPQMWKPNPFYKMPQQSNGDMNHLLQENVSRSSIQNRVPEGGSNMVITTQPRLPYGWTGPDNKLPSSHAQHMPRPPQDNNPHKLEKDHLVKFGTPPCYGVIKWIGRLPEIDSIMAGVEVVCMYIRTCMCFIKQTLHSILTCMYVYLYTKSGTINNEYSKVSINCECKF